MRTLAAVVLAVVLAAAPARADEARPRYRFTYAALAATGLLALGATVVSISTRSRFEDLDATCAPACDAEAVEDLRTRARVADAFWMTAGVAAAATLALFVWERGRGQPAPGGVAIRW